MSRLLKRLEEDGDEHDLSKELFLGIMMLMLCLGIMILNVAQPVWRAHQHDPGEGDVVVVYTAAGIGLSRDGYAVTRYLTEKGFREEVQKLISEPEVDLHLFDRGGSRERMVRHAAYADSLLSTDQKAHKVRTGVYVHAW